MARHIDLASPAHVRNLRLVQPNDPPYDHATEQRAPRGPVVLDEPTARYVLAHLSDDKRPTYAVAHAEAIRNLRAALGAT